VGLLVEHTGVDQRERRAISVGRLGCVGWAAALRARAQHSGLLRETADERLAAKGGVSCTGQQTGG